jgi:hypothetical protein
MPAQRSIELLQKHLHLLTPDKQAIARYVCESWPLEARFPQGVATHAFRAYGRSVHDLVGAQGVARELFLEAAHLARTLGNNEA